MRKSWLTELAYGHTAIDLDESGSALENKTVPSGHSLWAVAHWEPQVERSQDLKASLILRDEFGHLAGQADSLLVGDDYPGNRRWIPGVSSGTYHILSTLPAIAPGHYNLYLKVYEEQTGQVYPVIDQTGAIQGTEAQVGSVEVTRPAATRPVSPTNPLPTAPALTPELALLGYDLPSRTIYAGNVLPFTLYWKALSQPNQDYVVGIELRNQDGVVVQHLSQPANGKYPTTQWKAGDIVRDWQDVQVPATTPAGTSDVFVTMSGEEGPPSEAYLERVEVKNRPREYDVPPDLQPLSALFDEAVMLQGTDAIGEVLVRPGQVVTATLAWKVLSTPNQDRVRFLHVLGPDRRPVVQNDSMPCAGECATTSWLPTEILVDEVQITISADLAPGLYPVVVGWYDRTTLQRLPAYAPNGQRMQDGAVVLPTCLRVIAP